jgi:arabinogalactan oligomer/maltooligosaccharide transport system substrate-binding protein
VHKLNRQKGWVAALLLAALAVTLLMLAPASSAARERAGATTLRIWTDKDRRADIERIAKAWASSRGVDVVVVEKNFGDIRDQLKTIQPENAPDVVIGAHDWTGQLAADGSVVPLFPRKAIKSQIPDYALDAFSYGASSKKLYGAPVALENIGLVVNTRLAHVPKSWADLESQAVKFKRRASGNLGIAVQQGAAGDAYHMYPFFSGLCGYVFGRTKAGGLNPKDVGVANKRFLANASLIDRWNREGLVNSKVDASTAQDSFLKGKAAFWLTGPWNVDTLKKSGLRFRVVQVPKIKCASVPFLGVQGFMVTKFASRHGVLSLAKDLVGDYMLGSSAQASLAAANQRFPANVRAGKRVRDSVLAQFGRAGKGGVPMPNIPQMAAVWSDLGTAWVKATRGSGAVKARTAFNTAARNIRIKIASG